MLDYNTLITNATKEKIMTYELDSMKEAVSSTPYEIGKKNNPQKYEYDETMAVLTSIKAKKEIIIKGGCYKLTLSLSPADDEYQPMIDLLTTRAKRLKALIIQLGSNL